MLHLRRLFLSRCLRTLFVDLNLLLLNKKLEGDGITNIEPKILEYIAANVKSNIRELEGSLNKLIALSRLKKKEITTDLAAEAIQDYVSADAKRVVTLSYIVDIVADHYNLTPQEIYSKNRSNKIAYPRQIAMYLCRNHLQMSLSDIGKAIGGRDHTTVIYACEKIEADLKEDISLQNVLDILVKKLNL